MLKVHKKLKIGAGEMAYQRSSAEVRHTRHPQGCVLDGTHGAQRLDGTHGAQRLSTSSGLRLETNWAVCMPRIRIAT